MLLVLPVLVAMLLAILRGGALSHLATLPIRGSGFLIGSLAVQLAVYAPGLRGSAFVLHQSGAIYAGALGLVAIGALRNWQLGAAFRVATVGLALNVTVIVLNGGHMPVDAGAMAAAKGQAKVQEIAAQRVYDNTGIATPSSELPWLGDVIPVRLGFGCGNVFSVGDVLLASGASVAAYGAVRRPFGGASVQYLVAERST